MDYKLYRLNLDTFSTRVNENFRKNGGKEQIFYSMNRDIEKMLSVTAEIYDQKQERYKPMECMGKGMRSIYLLSLLETCKETRKGEPSLILMENPDLLSDFNSRQIRQMYQGENGYSRVCEKTDISAVLDNLGYSAGDLMNVNFVFILEGKQDKSRLPLLLKKYYSEIYESDISEGSFSDDPGRRWKGQRDAETSAL